jgi:hypothetical protein
MRYHHDLHGGPWCTHGWAGGVDLLQHTTVVELHCMMRSMRPRSSSSLAVTYSLVQSANHHHHHHHHVPRPRPPSLLLHLRCLRALYWALHRYATASRQAGRQAGRQAPVATEDEWPKADEAAQSKRSHSSLYLSPPSLSPFFPRFLLLSFPPWQIR